MHSQSPRSLVAFGLVAGFLALFVAIGQPPASGSEVGRATATEEDSTAAGAAAVDEADAESASESAPGAPLTPEHQRFLLEVDLLLVDEEREFFMALDESFRRDAFIDAFWKVRDPEPRTAVNELKRSWNRRITQALESYGSLDDDRARLFMFNGEPGGFVLADGRVVARCYHKRKELELWFYPGTERTAAQVIVVLFKREFPRDADYRAWRMDEPLRPAVRRRLPTLKAAEYCAEEILPGAMRWMQQNRFEYMNLLDRMMDPPEPNSKEWLQTFAASFAEIPPGAETFDVTADFRFPGRNQSRTALQGIVQVPAEAAAADGAGERRLLLVGEVVREGRLFESFRYRFDLPAGGEGETALPLVFQRYYRPGEVEVRLKVEDLLGRRYAAVRETLEVPDPEGRRSVRQAPEGELFRLLGEADEAAERGQTTLEIIPPEAAEIKIGRVRFTTVTTGDIDAVEFLLNGDPIMTKRRPPYSVSLNLGEAAATHRLRAVGYGAEGEEVASDEVVLNRGGQRFRVKLVEPRTDLTYADSLSAVATVEVPDDRELERLEIWLAEQRIATLYQPPFIQPVLLTEPGLTYVRAVAYLADGNSTEDVVFINAPDYFEQVDVRFVELYANVYDRRGRARLDLARDDFTVLEDGTPQEIRRFEFVRDLPVHAMLLLDTSASMEDSLSTVTEAAVRYLEQAVRPKDRVALTSFNNRPQIESPFTNDVEAITRELSTLRAGGSTALYDSLVFSLHYFAGMKGQKALLLLSDGEDEASQFDFDGALETAQRAGVTVYVIGMKEVARDRDAKKVLRRIADETGGRAFFIEDLTELDGIYAQIQEELRSQYLIAYQSSSDKADTAFRRIEVEVDEGGEVRTMAGYYP